MALRKIKYYSQQWNTGVLLCIGPQEEFVKYMKRSFKCPLQVSQDKSIQAYTVLLHPQQQKRFISHVIYMPSFQGTVHDLSMLAHQCIHVAWWILNDRQVESQDIGNQALAYTHGAVYGHFLSKLMKD